MSFRSRFLVSHNVSTYLKWWRGGGSNLGSARKTFFFRDPSLKDKTNAALPHRTFDTLCFFQVLHIQPPCRHSKSGWPGPVALCLLQVWSWLGKTVQIETIQGVLKKSFSELRFAKRQFRKCIFWDTLYMAWPFTFCVCEVGWGE